MAFYIERGP